MFHWIVNRVRKERHSPSHLPLQVLTLILTATFLFHIGFMNHITESNPTSYALDVQRVENLDDIREQLRFDAVYTSEYDAFTATVYCNLGSLYQKAGFLNQAKEMHQTSLTIRNKMLGKAHPDTAQSHNNMALLLMELGEYDEARSHIETALKSFGSLGSDYEEDFQAVRANYTDLLHEIGEYELADELESKHT